MNSVFGKTIYTGTSVIEDAFLVYDGQKITLVSLFYWKMFKAHGKLVPEFCAQLTAPKENQQYFISAYLPTYHFAEQFLRLKHLQLAAFYQSGFSFLCCIFNTTYPCKKFFAYIVFKAYRHGQSLPATHGLTLDRALSKYSKKCINLGVRVSWIEYFTLSFEW